MESGVEATKDPTPLGEEDGVQEPCMVVPVSSDPVDHKVDSESDPDVDEVSDDIDDEGVNEDGNINASSVGNQIRVLPDLYSLPKVQNSFRLAFLKFLCPVLPSSSKPKSTSRSLPPNIKEAASE
ncbi:hypothetical protein GOBAR_DD14886 [Gossypium barbadense]|nr:hypothetical protein GOBAR_DD14886 [Gossypium barbadense]